eukprot:scaffold120921_cov23-Prasinocladus_malaysianus.AAC.1
MGVTGSGGGAARLPADDCRPGARPGPRAEHCPVATGRDSPPGRRAAGRGRLPGCGRRGAGRPRRGPRSPAPGEKGNVPAVNCLQRTQPGSFIDINIGIHTI